MHSRAFKSFTFMYSGTSKQRTRWEQYKFSCFVLCREVVLFLEVVNEGQSGLTLVYNKWRCELF